MARWAGVREDTSAVDGEGFAQVRNASYYIEGELRRRPGKQDRLSLPADAMGAFKDTNSGDTWHLVAFDQSAGVIKTAPPEHNGTITTVKSGLSTSYNGNFAAANGRMYFAARGNNVQALEDGNGSAYDAGYTAPSGAIGAPTKSSGATTVGDHLVRYRYYDSGAGYLSNPSDPLLVNVASSSEGSLAFSVGSSGTDIITSSDSRVDKIILEMTTVGGDQYYDTLIFNNTSGTATVSMNDETLELQPQRAGNLAVGYAPPPQLRVLIAHKSRMFGLDSTDPNLLHWSLPGQPEGWDSTVNARRVFASTGDDPVALASVYDDLYIIGQFSMAKLKYYTDPAQGELDVIDSSGLGAWNQRCIVSVDGMVYGWGRIGAWAVPGGLPRKISRPIEDTLRTDVDESASDKFHGVFDPRERVITWFYVPTGGSTPTKAIVYDVDRKVWHTRDWQAGVTASVISPVQDGNLYAWIADENDYTWRLLQGEYDGVPSGTAAVFTAGPASTTTTVQVKNPTVSADLAGAYLYQKDSGETRRITGSTATAVTVSAAFTAVAEDDEFWIGHFDTVVLPKWASAGGMRNKSRPHGIEVFFVPDADAAGREGKVEIFADFSDTAELFTANDADFFSSGVSVTNNQRWCDIDLTGGSNDDGFLLVPMPSGWHRTWRARITFAKPSGDLRLVGFGPVLAGRDAAEVTDE